MFQRVYNPFGFNLPHMIGEIYTFKNEYFLHITNNTNMVNIFLQEILKIGFSWYIIGIIFPIVEKYPVGILVKKVVFL